MTENIKIKKGGVTRLKLKKDAEVSQEEKARQELVSGIAQNIKALAEGVRLLLNGPLKRKTIIVLLANTTQMTQKQIADVLVALENIENDWLN